MNGEFEREKNTEILNTNIGIQEQGLQPAAQDPSFLQNTLEGIRNYSRKITAVGASTLALAGGVYVAKEATEAQPAQAQNSQAEESNMATEEHKEECFKAALSYRPGTELGYVRKNGNRTKTMWLAFRDTKPVPKSDRDLTCPGTITIAYRARDNNSGNKWSKRGWRPNSKIQRDTRDSDNAPLTRRVPTGDYISERNKFATFRRFRRKKAYDVLLKKTYTAFDESKSKKFRFNGQGPLDRALWLYERTGGRRGGRPVQ